MTKQKLGFEQWMEAVDAIVSRALGLSVHDLPDCEFMSWYEAGMGPKTAAIRAVGAARD